MNAAESRFSLSEATKSIEGDIRAVVRGERPSTAVELCDGILAAGAASVADIEKLIEELQVARDYLKAEGDRVRRLANRYAHLTQTASASVKIIAESLGKWRSPERESFCQVHPANSEALAPDLMPGAELRPE